MLSVPVFWRLNKEKYNMIATKCVSCGCISFPVQATCSGCGNKNTEEFYLSGRGVVCSYTVIRASPVGFDAPYVVGIIKLEEGPTITGELLGIDIVSDELDQNLIGKSVTGVLRLNKINENGLRVYSIKFLLEE